ncbi:hypothetical protein MuYL_0668 [Mucilaginibacter xinganensis]|uniref:Uncharacterized protein n=1 Tax=Mucilaginibacter xinganensis TaxID=1234841 RepID=A0A223NST1_9SPHI|nr:hypothetical protein MuYL_0668 [Mucilaginibacter xinganensis]
MLPVVAVMNFKGQTQLFGQIGTTGLKLSSCDLRKEISAWKLSHKRNINSFWHPNHYSEF